MSRVPLKRRFVSSVKALQTLGLRWALQRIKFALMTKLGVLERRTPVDSWSRISFATFLKPGVPATPIEYREWRRSHSQAFLFDALPRTDVLSMLGTKSIDGANAIPRGEFPFFGYTADFEYPPRWKAYPDNADRASEGHWSRVNEFASGDVKRHWELSRFGWAYLLARAYARTQDDRYAETFWELLEDWMQHNQPYSGVNWKCGQEASFRTMAICFAFYSFRESAASTPQRVALLVTLIGALGKRIDSYIEYAQSQKNNHGISEGAGLWTIGLLFPELRDSERWRNRGKKVIECETRRQIYDDGSYVQHSTNYHRVMLQDLAWSLRLGEVNENRLTPDVYERFARAIRLLQALVDPESGWAPNLGANDGALVLPLSDSTFSDMRPVLQSCNYVVEKQRLFDRGPWDEEMLWMNGVESVSALNPLRPNEPIQSISTETGGYHSIQSNNSWALLRGARYIDRPSHADQLHFDLWWKGENVLCDPGTYSYNAPVPFDHAFAATRFHNTVTLDSADQMTRASRFLWADWANVRATRSSPEAPEIGVLQGMHDGYAKIGATHRRAIIQPLENIWGVVDDVTGSGPHTARVHWLTPDVPFDSVSSSCYELNFKAGAMRLIWATTARAGFDLVRAGEHIAGDTDGTTDSARGWISRHYGKLEPALSFAAECHSELPIRFLTVVQLGSANNIQVSPSCSSLFIGDIHIKLSAVGQAPITARFA